MLFRFPLLIVCIFVPFLLRKKISNLTLGKETYHSMRTFVLIKKIFYFSFCFGNLGHLKKAGPDICRSNFVCTVGFPDMFEGLCVIPGYSCP